MLVEFSIVPTDKGESLSRYVAKVLDVIDKSGLAYKLTPMDTVVEGEWDEIIPLIRKCHDIMREHSNRVLTSIKIDDRKEAKGRLEGKKKSIEMVLERKLK
ncbi:MAG TPA: MTH1187 family thiamine-binding protein [Nitrospinota bacterium]|nr:MTH1187 family thiamine-binding protein [Nitrospinota bacterium]